MTKKITRQMKIQVVYTALRNIQEDGCICGEIDDALREHYDIDIWEYSKLRKKFGLGKYKPKKTFERWYWFPFNKKGLSQRKTILRKLIKELEAK